MAEKKKPGRKQPRKKATRRPAKKTAKKAERKALKKGAKEAAASKPTAHLERGAPPVVRQVADVIMGLLSEVPPSAEPQSALPHERARRIATQAAFRASGVAGALALPPGIAGFVTILPELAVVWRIQAQMVADIAGCFGRSATLTREQMIFCLFKHSAAQAVRDLTVRVGQRVLIRRAPLRVLQKIAGKIGYKVTQRLIGRGVARMLPAIGALGVAGYAYFDTAQVARTAISLFEKEVAAEA